MVGEGVSLRYRFRVPPGSVARETTPPIKGLQNPPDRAPESLYPRGVPWLIDLPDAHLQVRELWLEDYRYQGDAALDASLVLGGASVDAKVALEFVDGAVTLGEEPVADGFHGTLGVTIDELPRETGIGRAAFSSVSGEAILDADVRSLAFFHAYLERAPWLAIDGSGKLRMDVALDFGRFREKSWLTAETHDLAVHFLSYDIVGDGVVRLEATDELDVPMSRLSIDFGAYTISETGQLPLVEGTGFSVDAMSPDLALDEPFTTLDVVLDLPESDIRNIALYNAFFPEDIGFALSGGTGKVRGRLTASTLDNVAAGDVWIDGDDLRGRLDDLGITLDLALHAKLSEGRLAEGLYDFSGTRLELRNVGMKDHAPAEKGARVQDETRSWWATVDIPSGQARVGKPIYLDATVVLKCADSVPFVRVLSERKELANWIQGLLSIPDIRGSGRVALGADTVTLDGFSITGGNYEVLMRWFRQRRTNHGSVFARLGKLSVGVAIEGTDQEIHLFNAREWFDGLDKKKKGEPEVPAETPKAERKDEKASRKEGPDPTLSRREARQQKQDREPRRSKD